MPGTKVCSGLAMKAVGLEVALLLLLSGDVEVNPGPLGQGDLRFLHCELHPVSHKWYSLGVQLQIPVETLKCIRSDNPTVTECLLEMLTIWLQRTNPPPTWNMLTEALESPPVGEQQLTQQLRDKYCPRKEGGGTHCFPTQRRTSLPSAPSAAQECLNTKPPAHNESMANTFRGSEEHSPPTAGCEGVKDLQKDCVSLVSGLERVSVYSAPTTLPTTAIHLYQQSQSQPHPQHLYYPMFQPPHQHPTHQSLVQPHTYQPPHCPPFSTVVEQSYQYTDHVQPSYYQPTNHNVNHQHSYTPTSDIPHQYPYHQSSPFPHQFSTHVCPSIHYHLISPKTPIGKYAAYLRAYYTGHEFTSTKWPHLDARKYIKLAVISNEYANREELERFRQQTIHGSIDDILEWKAPIEMKDILEPNVVFDHVKREPANYPVTQLLIEGAPGIGKSTFAWEVSQKWGQYQLFNDYSLLVLLNFRDKRVQEAQSISDLFYHPHPKLQSEIVDNIVLSSGHGLLLILEGFDEAPATQRTVNSIFVRLFRGQELPKATVILTTRPSASAGLRKLCSRKYSRRVEILGFGKKEIDEYIQCAFLDEQSRSDFKMYLSLYPYFHTMYVPLNSAIVVAVYKSCKSSGIVVPQTMTQLYSSLIRTLLLRYLKDKAEYSDDYRNIDGFKDLPQAVYNQFCEICKIAHMGIMSAETEIIFQDLPHDFDTLGLMQSCPELYVDRGASVSYNFLHLTLQEYLAAYHISQQSRHEQVAFMQEHIQNKKLEVVVKFLAGLTELGQDLWDGMRDFACRTVPPDSLLWKETVFIKLPTLYCYFESQDPSVIASVLTSDYACFSQDCRSALPFDLYILGYCVTYSTCDWKLGLHNCKLDTMKSFLRALEFQYDQCLLSSAGKIKGILLSWSDPAAVHLLVENMPQMSVFNSVTHLGLINSNLTSETCNLLSKYTELLCHLEYLDLSANFTIGGGGVANLITSLTTFNTVRELHLWKTDIGFEDCKALGDLLISSKSIEVLDISDNKLADGIQFIVNGLSHNASLEKLNMWSSNFSSENVLSLAHVLRVNTSLKELDIAECSIQSRDSVHLAKALEESTCTQVQTLGIQNNIVGSEGAVAFAHMLKKNQCLKTLDLCDDSIGVEGATALFESLKHNTTLERLLLSPKCKLPLFSTLDEELQDRVTFS